MENSKTYRIIISGGGTGGHVYPAIAIANELSAVFPNCEILFIGALGKMEMKRIPEAGYKIIGLWISGLARKLTFKNLLFPVKLIHSYFKALKIVKSFKPDMVVGTGGYASGPTVMAANTRKIPVILQEQNSYPGITNRQLAKRAVKVCVAYPGMDKFFDPAKIVFTGNPVRSDIGNLKDKEAGAQEYFNFKEKRNTLFIMGGSLGARTVNRSVLADWEKLKNADVNVIWQTGKFYYDDIKTSLNPVPEWLHLAVYIDRMDLAYSLADVVISRAGALSISELCVAGKPCILVPSPNVAENHQQKNAEALVKNEAAIMILDDKAEETMIEEGLKLLQDVEKRKKLAVNILKMGKPNAAKEIVQQIKLILN